MGAILEFWFVSDESLKVGSLITAEERRLAKSPYWISETEQIIEAFRLRNKPKLPSRLKCFFGAPSKEMLLTLIRDGCAPSNKLFMYRAEMVDNTEILLTDPELYCTLVGATFPMPGESMETRIRKGAKYAQCYFAGVSLEESGLKEILYAGRLKILEKYNAAPKGRK